MQPTEVDGVVLWIQASACHTNSSSRVSFCPDRSGRGNAALQSTDFSPPLLIADALGGHAVLSFDGGGDTTNVIPTTLVVADAESLRLGNGQFSAIVVGRWRNPNVPRGTAAGTYSGYGGFFHKAEPSSPYRGVSLFAGYPGAMATSAAFTRLALQLELGDARVLSISTDLNDNQYRIYTAHRANEEIIELRIDGTRDSVAVVWPEISVSAIGQPLVIGGQHGAPLRGEIAELLLIGGHVSDAVLAGLELGLKEKYGL